MGSNSDASAALPPPPGEHSNFVDPPSIQAVIIGALTVCLVISTFSAILRCYAQWSLFKKLIWADFWMLLGWAFHVGFAAFLYACLPYGAGRHQWNVTKNNFARINFLLFTDFILYDIAILGPKISILLQLKAIFVPRGRGITTSTQWFFWATYILIAVNLVFYIALSFALIFQCDPVARGWDTNVPGHCLDQNSLLESSGPFNIVSDFLIFLLPLWAIWQLQLPIKTRLGAASAFAVGFFGCVCSAVRLYYSDRLKSSGDATYLIFQNQLWANAEITTAVLIANIIIVPRFIRFKRGISSNYDYSDRSSSRNYGKSRSMGTHHRMTHRVDPSDPYIELTDTNSNIQPEEDIRSQQEHNAEQPPSRGILRTVQIDTTEEVLGSPARTAVNARSVDVAAGETGNRTRLYDSES